MILYNRRCEVLRGAAQVRCGKLAPIGQRICRMCLARLVAAGLATPVKV